LKKIVYIFRGKKSGRHSIEEIYLRVSRLIVKEGFKSYNFFYLPKKHLLGNIFTLFKVKPDIYHITGGVNFIGIFLPSKKTVLTIHDIGHYKELTGFKKWLYGLLWIQLPAWRVKKIIAVSNFTKNDLIKYFKVPEEKIEVIHNPVPSKFKYKKRMPNGKPRILQIGASANKNLPILIKALTEVKCELVIIGEISTSIIEQLDKSKILYKNYKDLTHEEVYEQYLNSDLVSFVSLHEGFGMIVIEANAVGRPIITSNVCSIPEVANDAALLVNPADYKMVRKGILEILDDETLKNRLVTNGFENIKRFQETEIVSQYADLYKQIF